MFTDEALAQLEREAKGDGSLEPVAGTVAADECREKAGFSGGFAVGGFAVGGFAGGLLWQMAWCPLLQVGGRLVGRGWWGGLNEVPEGTVGFH